MNKKLFTRSVSLCVLIFIGFISCKETSIIPIDRWTYIEVDSTRGKWGDLDEPEWLRYFGLAMYDVDQDGDKDIISGRYYYRNPGGDMTSYWYRTELGLNVDAMLVVNVDDDEMTDVIGEALPDVYWLEAEDKTGTGWETMKICSIPPTSHINGQGYILSQIIPGGKPEILLTADKGVWCIEIPDNPGNTPWKTTLIASSLSEEGIGIGDIDGDQLTDIIVGDHPEGGEEPTLVKWYANPGDGSGNWKSYIIGETDHAVDRVGVADMDNDGKLDIVISEERYPGLEPDANLYWFSQPENPFSSGWERIKLITQYSMNNLDIADIDRDGDMDIVTNEHKGTDYKLQIFENDGEGHFTEHTIDTGKESHLGTRLADMDGDGDLDIISITWDHYQYLHLWRNDGILVN